MNLTDRGSVHPSKPIPVPEGRTQEAWYSHGYRDALSDVYRLLLSGAVAEEVAAFIENLDGQCVLDQPGVLFLLTSLGEEVVIDQLGDGDDDAAVWWREVGDR